MSRFVHGGDIDLDAEEVYLADGTRLTEARAAELGEQIAARAFRGRPSLSSSGEHSPQLGVRVSGETHARIVARAEREGKTVSQIAREAIDKYV